MNIMENETWNNGNKLCKVVPTRPNRCMLVKAVDRQMDEWMDRRINVLKRLKSP